MACGSVTCLETPQSAVKLLRTDCGNISTNRIDSALNQFGEQTLSGSRVNVTSHTF